MANILIKLAENEITKLKYLLSVLILFLFFLGTSVGLTIPPTPDSLVKPEIGSLYKADELIDNQNIFQYNLEISVIKNLGKKGPILLILMIKNPFNGNWEIASEKLFYPNCQKWFNVTVDLSNITKGLSENYSILKRIDYKLIAPSLRDPLFTGSGPDIKANFRNESYEQRGKNIFRYSVEVNSSIPNLKIFLKTKKSENASWIVQPNSKSYNSRMKWERLVWENQTYFSNIKFIPEYSDEIKNSAIKTPPSLWIDGLIEGDELADESCNVTQDGTVYQYTIIVKNSGGFDLKNVTVNIDLNQGIKPEDRIIQKINKALNESNITSWTEKIGSMNAWDVKEIKFEAYVDPDADERGLYADAQGIAPDGSVVSSVYQFNIESYMPHASGINPPI